MTQPPSPEPPLSERDIAHKLAAEIAGTAGKRTQLPPGDIADLRRVDARNDLPVAFWQIWARHLVESEHCRTRIDEHRWALALRAMAALEGLHQPGRPLGEALARSGISEVRLTRLLRASEEQLPEAVRSVTAWLGSKGEPSDLADLALLLLQPESEDLRRSLARSYYSHVDKKDS